MPRPHVAPPALLLFALAASCAATARAAAPEPGLQVHRLGSRVFGGTRSLRVLLPRGYADRASASRRYPVLYLNDGQNLFDAATATFGGGEWHVDETVRRLEAAGEIRPLIVVGIDHGGRRQRAREYLPWPDDTLQPPEPDPQGARYPEFLLRDVVPFVESRFRADGDPMLRGLGGSSYGALAAAYTAATSPGAFGRLLLESPSLYVAGGRIFDLFRRWPERLALGAGTNELGRPSCSPADDGGEAVADVRRLAALARAAGVPAERVLVTIAPCAMHEESAWAARLPAALRFLYAP